MVDEKEQEDKSVKENINQTNIKSAPEPNPITKPLKLKLLNNQNLPKKLVIKNLKSFLVAKTLATAKPVMGADGSTKISTEHAKSLLSNFKN